MTSTYIHNILLTQSIQMAFFLYLSSLVLRIGLLQSLTVLKVDFVLKKWQQTKIILQLNSFILLIYGKFF